jgi:protein N-terminal methyltransferase
VEPSLHFLEESRRLAPSWPRQAAGEGEQSGVRMYQAGLQDFDPRNPGNSLEVGDVIGARDGWQHGYDVVWIQWCAGHLSDDQFILFLQRSKASLRQEGIIVVKENQTRFGDDKSLFDEEDSSLTR